MRGFFTFSAQSCIFIFLFLRRFGQYFVNSVFLHGVLISHSDRAHAVGQLRTSDQHDAENSDNTQNSQKRGLHALSGIRKPNPPQTHVLDHVATGIDTSLTYSFHLAMEHHKKQERENKLAIFIVKSYDMKNNSMFHILCRLIGSIMCVLSQTNLTATSSISEYVSIFIHPRSLLCFIFTYSHCAARFFTDEVIVTIFR